MDFLKLKYRIIYNFCAKIDIIYEKYVVFGLSSIVKMHVLVNKFLFLWSDFILKYFYKLKINIFLQLSNFLRHKNLWILNGLVLQKKNHLGELGRVHHIGKLHSSFSFPILKNFKILPVRDQSYTNVKAIVFVLCV